MATNTYWDTSAPVNSLPIPDAPAEFRFNKTNIKAIFGNEHHTFPDGSNSGAYHSQGSATAFYSAVASPPATRADGSSFTSADLGRVWITSDTKAIYVLTAITPTWTLLSAGVTSSAPYITLTNTTAEDTDGGRESRVIGKGTQSGAEETTLGYIEFSHEGTGDDEKGQFIIKLNDGDDTDTPSKQPIGYQSTGKIDVANSLSVLDEDDMSSDDAECVPTQQSVKAYVDAASTRALGTATTEDADTATLGYGVTYTAVGDGEICAYTGLQNNVNIEILVDGVLRMKSNPVASNVRACASCLVPSGSTFRVNSNDVTGNEVITWQPFGTLSKPTK